MFLALFSFPGSSLICCDISSRASGFAGTLLRSSLLLYNSIFPYRISNMPLCSSISSALTPKVSEIASARLAAGFK